MQLFHDIKVGLDDELEEHLSRLDPQHGEYRVLKKSVDARQRHNPHLVYTVEVYDADEPMPKNQITIDKVNYKGPKPIIIGAGPAGLLVHS